MRNKPRFSLVYVFAATLLLLGSLAWPGSSVQADTLIVTKLTDTNDGVCDGDCSLREAIVAANATPGADTITLPSGTFFLSLVGDEDFAAAGDLDVRAPLNLVGQGAEETIIDASALGDRVFNLLISATTVSMSGVSITGVTSAATHGGGIACDRLTLTLDDVSLTNNDPGTSHSGGGLYAYESTVTLTNSRVVGNTGSQGGGIYVYGGELTMVDCEVSDNTATESVGGIYVYDAPTSLTRCSIVGNTAPHTGGLSFRSPGERLILDSCLVANNTAVGDYAEVGGIMADEGSGASIVNCTISGNEAGGYAGGIEVRMPMTITHSTIVNNVASVNEVSGYCGGLFAYQPANVYLQDTIIANNVSILNPIYDDCVKWGAATVTSLGYNLVEKVGNCVFGATGDITGQDPLLGALQDNGGTSWTHALLASSPALNAGNPAVSSTPQYDQRGTGFGRVIDGRVDIGAYEAWVNVFVPLVLK